MFCSENTGLISEYPRWKNTFYWEVPNYFAFQQTTNYQKIDPNIIDPRVVSSPLFSAFNNKWRLALILNGGNSSNAHVGFFLWRMTSSDKRPHINVKLFLLDCDGEECKSCDGDVDFNGCFGNWQFLYLRETFEDKDKISPAGVLKFVCVMKESSSIVPVIGSDGSEYSCKYYVNIHF